MKKTLIFVIIIIAAYLLWTAIQTKPNEAVEEAIVGEETTTEEVITNEVVTEVEYLDASVSFTGFGPGKKHLGSFSGVDSKLAIGKDGKLSGQIVVDMNTLSTDTEGVTKHLKTDAFFDVAKFPTAFFALSSIENNMATGVMTIKGVTKDISFPIVESDTEWTTTFTLNMKEFGIDQTFANETVEIQVIVFR